MMVMSGDEVLTLVVSAVIAAFTWYWWYTAVRVRSLVMRNASRPLFVAAPIVCFMLLCAILLRWAADDVRHSGTYMTFYMVVGAAWMGLCAHSCSLFGISPRDDIVERQNLAAAFAATGALAGITLCFAGGNVGNGPGWWVVVFSAGLATGVFFVLWALVEWLTSVSESITVERADGAGLRLGGFLAGMGMILGRSVAGDWVSVEATVRDFMTVAWPVVPLAVAAALVERVLPFDPKAPWADVLVGLSVSGLFVGTSFLYVFVWQGMP